MTPEQKQIIKDFINATPMWLKQLEKQSLRMEDNGKCLIVKRGGCKLCGARFDKIKELYEALKELEPASKYKVPEYPEI